MLAIRISGEETWDLLMGDGEMKTLEELSAKIEEVKKAHEKDSEWDQARALELHLKDAPILGLLILRGVPIDFDTEYQHDQATSS